MDPILLHKQLKDNAKDVEDYYRDLRNWATPTSHPKTVEQKNKSSERPVITAKPDVIERQLSKATTDYSAWERFDVEEECRKVDEVKAVPSKSSTLLKNTSSSGESGSENDTELSDEFDQNARENAYLEKEQGNKYVQLKMWEMAIQSYTRAIKHFNMDPIFYANRALCHLKLNKWIQAENDCSFSLKLDQNYVKAYQRRAAARCKLNKYKQAEEDLLQVLKLEPYNKESQQALREVRTKLPAEVVPQNPPKSKFSMSRKRTNSTPTLSGSWSPLKSSVVPVKAIQKPPHLRSKVALKRIITTEAVSLVSTPQSISNQGTFPQPNQSVIRPDDFKIVERTEIVEPLLMIAPKNFVQFYEMWNRLSNRKKYDYLRLIQPQAQLHYIFQESLESSIFSEILQILAEFCLDTDDSQQTQFLLDWLQALTHVKRFSTLILFLSAKDKDYLNQLMNHLENVKCVVGDAMKTLRGQYEL